MRNLATLALVLGAGVCRVPRDLRSDTPVDPPPVLGPATPPSLGGCPVFPSDNPWNQDVSALPVDPASQRYIANVQSHGAGFLHADFGARAVYGMPYVVVPAGQAMVPVRFTEYANESDPGPYPIPAQPPIEGGNDHHVLIVQQSTCMLYELYHAAHDPTGWTAGAGARWDLRSNATRHAEWTSCDQAGLPVLPGLARYDEVAAGAIRHALRFTVEHTQAAWVAPATHPGSTDDPDAPPMGLRLRLKATYDIRRFRGQSRVILEALRHYGMFVADTGTNWYISGATDPRWDDDDLRQLAHVPGDAFEVVQAPTVHHRR